MSDPIKMTEEELNEVQTLQANFADRISQFGRLYLEKMQVESAIKAITDKETNLQDEWKSLQKTENELLEKILKKYGEGSLDIKNGIFIPDKSSQV